MTDTGVDTPQNNFISNQNFDPDVKKMFKHFVTGGHTPDDNSTIQNIGIDDIRGQISVSITGDTTQNLIKSLNINPASNTIAGTPNTTTPVQLAQESRCHAFYRIIGFPVVNSDQSDFYNPGLDIIKGNNITRQVTLERKLRIASNVGKKFEALSQAREQYASQCLQIFSVPTSIEAGVLALTSGTFGNQGNVNKRKFAQPFEKSKLPFDYDPDKQSYSNPGDITSTFSLVGNNEVLLSDYQDPDASADENFKPKVATGGGILFGHRHIIKPFIVDPRIDFSIWSSESKTSSGVSRRIAVPFVPDASYLRTSSTATSERPLLEKIITDRFAVTNIQDAGTASADVINYVKSFKDIQSVNIGNTSVSDIFSGKVFKLSQQQAFGDYLKTIQALMFKLVDAMRMVHARQGSYYWLPIPDTSGPEGGCDTRDVPIRLGSNLDRNLLTVNDFDIIEKQASTLISSLNSSILQTNNTPVSDVGSYAFSNYKLTPDPSNSDSYGNLSQKTQNKLDSIRATSLGQAADALQIIEMIMGEFSGLGLADIVAIMGSLYVIPINDLLGFLDDDAIVRAETSLKQPAGSLKASRSGIVPAMTSLCDTVKGFYEIMDKIFEDYMNNGALNL